MSKVSQESFQKALDILGLTSEATTDQVEPTAEEIKKAEEDKQAEEAKVAKEAEVEKLIIKAKELGVDLIKGDGGTKSVDLGSNSDANGGTITTQPAKRSEGDDTLIKAIDEKVVALGTLYQKSVQENEELKKSVDESNAFHKALAERLGMIEKQPLDRKSVVTATEFTDRFQKGGNGAEEGTKNFSISNAAQRNELVNIMFDAAVGEEGVKDKEFAKAVEYLEISKSLGSDRAFADRIQKRLKSEHKITISK